MKNENIDKKNKGLKIGIIALSIFSTILLIFNLLLCATFKDKDYQIKALESSCEVIRREKHRSSSTTITDLDLTSWVFDSTYRGFSFDAFPYSGSSLNVTLNVSGTFVINDTSYNFISLNYQRYSTSGSVYFYQTASNTKNFLRFYYDNSGSYKRTYRDVSGGSPIYLTDVDDVLTINFDTSCTDTKLIKFVTDNFVEYVPPIDEDDEPILYNGEYIDQIDYSKTNPLIYWSNTLYNNGSMISTPSNLSVNITGVEFMSNGFLFNKITINLISLGGLNITTDNNVIDDNLGSAYSSYSCFYNMIYSYESDERNYSIYVTSVGFHYLPHSSASSSFAIAVNPLEKTWLNEEYKTLNIVSASDDLCVVPAYSNLTGYELLKLQSDFTSTTLGDTNVFALLSQAFSALSSILSIRIIPGISIGLLIFIPLVVSIIIAIIKLIGK